MPKINYKLKQQIIKEYFSGTGSTTLSRKYKVSKSVILRWINRIKNENFDMITSEKRYRIEYSVEFKIKVLNYKNSNNCTLSELYNKFKIHSESTIYFWQRQFDELGIIGLSRKRGNPKMNKDRVTKQTKFSKDDELKQLKEAILKLPKTHFKRFLHSDQGVHYQNKHLNKFLKKNHITQSMSRKATCLDNAVIESFFHLLKIEIGNNFNIKEELINSVRNWIYYYNNFRIKTKLGGKSPIQYRKLVS